MTLPRVPFLSAVKDCTSKGVKVQRKDYLAAGALPVVDQGQEFVAGYTRQEHQYSGALPVILFGDHTRAFKYVDFPFALGADGVKVLSPTAGFDAKYLYYFFRSIDLPNAGYSRHFKFLKEVEVPRPSMAEQLRIVEFLSRADGVVRLRREAQQKAAELVPAIFRKMFGDPISNDLNWAVAPLGELCEVKGGGTPSKSNPQYWIGNIPWVSPKDMGKSDLIFDAEDHISDEAIARSATNLIPEGSMLVVTRSGVLKHSVPCGLCARSVAINQDIKAFIPGNAVHRDFLLAQFQIRRREVLGLVRVGATVQNIETDALKRLSFVVPPLKRQLAFVEMVDKARAIRVAQHQGLAKASEAFDSLLVRAFNS